MAHHREGSGHGPPHKPPIVPTPGAAPIGAPPPAPVLLRQIAKRAKAARLRAAALLAGLKGRRIGVYDGDVPGAYKRLKVGVGRSPDVILRTLRLGGKDGPKALLAFVTGLADNQMVDQDILALAEVGRTDLMAIPAKRRAQALARRLTVGHVTFGRSWTSLVAQILAGNAVVFVEGATTAIVLDTTKYPARSVEKPDLERSILGSQEGFNEVLLTHMNQIRRYAQTPALMFESVVFGSETKTNGIVVYIDGVANPALVEAVRRRLKGIADATTINLTRIASSLKDNAWTPFPLVRMTPRVDFVAREVLSGRVAVMIDNSPMALLMPAAFFEFFRTSDDYEGQFWGATLNRLVRVLGFWLSAYAPALYVALSDVNPDFLPTRLLWTVAGSRENIPFPPPVEVLIMFIVFEILREAAIRMPASMNTAIGTVGAVIIGTAIVKAGIVSSLIIVVVAVGALAVFTMPAWEMTITLRWLLWPMVFGAYAFGVVGIVLVTLLMIQHMASLSSFGVPYLSPFGPFRVRDWKDTLVRAPLRDLRLRPSSLFTLKPRAQPPIGRRITEPDVPLASARRRHT